MVSQVAHLKETKRCARCALYASQGRPEDGDPGRRMRLPGPLLARWVGEATGREHRTPYPRVGCARRQDADTGRHTRALGARGDRTRTSSVPPMDGDWFYLHVLCVKQTRPAWVGEIKAHRPPDPSSNQQSRPNARGFCKKNDITHKILVHSRDAPCVRPAGLRTQHAWLLHIGPNGVHPARPARQTRC